MDAEDSSELRFNEALNDATFLSNAEVAVILGKDKDEGEVENEVYQKTLAHCQRFSGFMASELNISNISALQGELQNKMFEDFKPDGTIESKQLHNFEVTALMNLDPEDYDEAVALIPSMQKRFSEDQIEELLQILSKGKNKM
eukprot:maker-scaffold_4-snap-gene-14.2-mRNA-1 protein AED:0.12 eAED:0.12 QI:84/1/1/1/1/1/2/140/142